MSSSSNFGWQRNPWDNFLGWRLQRSPWKRSISSMRKLTLVSRLVILSFPPTKRPLVELSSTTMSINLPSEKALLRLATWKSSPDLRSRVDYVLGLGLCFYCFCCVSLSSCARTFSVLPFIPFRPLSLKLMFFLNLLPFLASLFLYFVLRNFHC